MNFYRLRPRAWLGIDPAEVLLPSAHSGHRSSTGPDATPKSSPAPRDPSRAPEPLPSYDPTDAAVREALIDLTERHHLSPLAAAQTLFAPELLEDNPHA